MISYRFDCTMWSEISSNKNAVTVLLVIAACFWYLCSFLIKSRPSLPPGPYGLPIVGYLPFLGTSLHTKFAELARRYGPIYMLRLGSKPCIVLTSPSMAKEVLRDQDATFANHDPPVAALALTYGGVDILWSPFGSYWRNLRKVFVREMQSNTSLDACYDLRRDEVRKIISNIYNTKIGSALDIGEITFLTELNLVTSLLWGGTLGGEKTIAEFREVVTQVNEVLGMPNISDFFPVLAWFDIQGIGREMKGYMQRVERIFNTIIDERKQTLKTAKLEGISIKNEGRKDFLQILLEIKEQEEEKSATQMDMTQIKAILIDIVIGGTDTSAAATEWVMAEILSNPEVMKKVLEELTDVVGMNTIVEESHLPKLHYLNAVVKETYRLHPPVPLLVPHQPSQSCIVGGYKIPKGSRVFLNAYAIHRDPQLWENPSQFKPERFLNDSIQKLDYRGNNFQYFPFGSGRRSCAGLPLAEKMVMYILASLLHSFEWRLAEDQKLDLSDSFGIVLKKKTPLIAIPSQRLLNPDLYL